MTKPFFTAPFLLFNRPELVPHLRVLGVTILISGVKNVQSAYVSKHFLFKKFFFSTLGGTITAAVVGLWMASQGFGVWALVAQYLVNTTIDTAILWITVKWRPQKYFSFKRLGVLFSYGWKLLVSSLLNVGYGQMTKWLIGLKYTNTDLGCYDNAESFTGFLANNVNTSIDTVLFPAMAGAQDDRARVKSMTRRAMKTSIFVLAPMMAGLAACSESIIKVVLTDEWLLSIPFILILAITYTFYPLHTANLNAMKALGRSDKFLKLEIIKKSIGVVLLLLSMNYGVMAITLTYLVSDIASQIINTFPNKKLIDYGYFEQLKDILPTVLLAWAMGGIVFCVRLLGLNSLVTLLIQIPLGILIYYLGARLFKMESLDFALNALKSIIGKKEKKA